MNQVITQSIVLSRINFLESDRILTVLTPDYGKVRLIAKGSRALKSRLAGGIELFSVNDIGFIKGRSDISTLVSSRLERHFLNILKDINRVQFGYEILKVVNRHTEDGVESSYFWLLARALEGLNDLQLNLALVQLWFFCRLLAVSGQTPNLLTDDLGENLRLEQAYDFNYDSMAFMAKPKGVFSADHIKLLRLAVTSSQAQVINRVRGVDSLIAGLSPLISTISQMFV